MNRLHLPFAIVLIFAVTSVHVQSLYLSGGESAVEASVGWSVGPCSRGIEPFSGVGLGGRVDVGLGIRGRYIQLGTTVYRLVRLTDRFALQPFVGFASIAESYAFGGGPAETAEYLTRDLGMHFSTGIERQWALRVTLIEQSLRRERYRGARAAVLRRL